jgi:hypothetical protein
MRRFSVQVKPTVETNGVLERGSGISIPAAFTGNHVALIVACPKLQYRLYE